VNCEALLNYNFRHVHVSGGVEDTWKFFRLGVVETGAILDNFKIFVVFDANMTVKGSNQLVVEDGRIVIYRYFSGVHF
tara:strand:- start:168 stop:401 length:234 start_codon:yes stop_codon:yes gene_type:complete